LSGAASQAAAFYRDDLTNGVVFTVKGSEGFAVHELTLSDFPARWLPGLAKDGVLAGVNRRGARTTGFDREPSTLIRILNAQP
jgi:hypothetical protein